MIYIFDDRTQRRKDNEEELKKYSDFIKFRTIDPTSEKSVEDYMVDIVDNPECILLHKSYTFSNDDISFEKIRHLFTSLNVPVVIFSGGIEGSNKSIVGENVEINMNADLMYLNFPLFIDDLKANGNINLDILLWGKQYKLNAALNFQNQIANECFINNDLEDTIEDIEKVTRLISRPCQKFSKDFGSNIINELKKLDKPTWLDLAIIIDKNIEVI